MMKKSISLLFILLIISLPLQVFAQSANTTNLIVTSIEQQGYTPSLANQNLSKNQNDNPIPSANEFENSNHSPNTVATQNPIKNQSTQNPNQDLNPNQDQNSNQDQNLNQNQNTQDPTSPIVQPKNDQSNHQLLQKSSIDRIDVLITFKKNIDYHLLNELDVQINQIFDTLLTVSATIPSTKLAILQTNEQIQYIEHEQKVYIDSVIVNDTDNEAANTIHSLTSTNTQKPQPAHVPLLINLAHQNGWTGKGIKIGIIDTGIRTDHPDLKVAGGVSFIQGQASYNDDEGHGTHVAGIIAAKDNHIGTIGVSPDAEIYAIKALNKEGTGTLTDVIAGIEWSMKQNLDIINLSLTSEKPSQVLENALNKAYEKGILIVAAAGNADNPLPNNTNVLYPARYDQVIAVGSINKNYQLSDFSYFGPALEFVAPGEKIYSTSIIQDYEYRYGTSMAAPFVTGIAALYKQAFPKLTHKDIRSLMQKTAYDLGEPNRDAYFGFGLIQAPAHSKDEVPIEMIFTDVHSTDWYADEIQFLYGKNIITGYEDGKFKPNAHVTRAEAVTMLGRVLGYEEKQGNTIFHDVNRNHFASGYIHQAYKNNMINGFPDGTFGVNAPITRGDVATILYRAFPFEKNNQITFSDVLPNKYYTEPIASLYTAGLITGYTDNTFRPLKEITRGEFAVLLARVLNEKLRVQVAG